MTPGGVAIASLQQALASGEVKPDECTVLNISGGGVERLKREHETAPVEPWLRVTKENGAAMIVEALSKD